MSLPSGDRVSVNGKTSDTTSTQVPLFAGVKLPALFKGVERQHQRGKCEDNMMNR